MSDAIELDTGPTITTSERAMARHGVAGEVPHGPGSVEVVSIPAEPTSNQRSAPDSGTGSSSTTMCDGRVVVVDDVLDCHALEQVESATNRMRFETIDIRRGRIWDRHAQFNPTVGDRFVWCDDGWSAGRPAAGAVTDGLCARELLVKDGFRVHPTGTAFDLLVDIAVRTAHSRGLLENGSADPFSGVCATVYKYSKGTYLRWHTDGMCLGAFVAYLSPDWDENAGGYLAIQENPRQRAAGFAHIIEPRVNRLVLMSPDVRHSVLCVNRDAAASRISLSGFLFTRRGMSGLVANAIQRVVGSGRAEAQG